MIIKKEVLTFLLFVFGLSLNYSQVISGIVIDGKTEKPLAGASVFFNNSIIGTISNSKGEFSLELHKGLNMPLIISFLGYETNIVKNYTSENTLKIYLYESAISLNEVEVFYNDDWTREYKLYQFKKHFLGESKNGLSCLILNEEDIVLRYNDNSKQLTVMSEVPIVIKNNKLKYLINVQLEEFEINYDEFEKMFIAKYIYYSGYNFFKSLQSNPSKKIQKRRNKAYSNSIQRFMRALKNNQLEKKGYDIYLNNNKVNPEKYITIIPLDTLNNVKVKLNEKLFISHNNDSNSSIESLEKEFNIDNFGNYSPVNQVKFEGAFGEQRMGDALPLDFLLLDN